MGLVVPLSREDILLLRARYEERIEVYTSILDGLAMEVRNALPVRFSSCLLASRVKSPESVERRLWRERGEHSPEKCPGSSPPLRDLVGIRLIPHTRAEVDDIVQHLEGYFRRGKRILGKPKRFTDKYRAVHLYVRAPERLKSTAIGEEIRCEIQVIALPDHLWAELNHDVAYKHVGGLPDTRESAFLESLRDELDLVERSVDRLKRSTERRREANRQEITGPERLRTVLEHRGREPSPVAGDHEGLFELLSSVVDGLTGEAVDRLLDEGIPERQAKRLLRELDADGEQGEVGVFTIRFLSAIPRESLLALSASSGADRSRAFWGFARRAARALLG